MPSLSFRSALAVLTSLFLGFASAQAAVEWRYTTDQPGENWASPDFDDQAWKSGPGGFGTSETPGSRVGTEWKSADIWLRRTFELAELPARPALLIHHDEDTEIFLNGVEAARFEKWSQTYAIVPLGDAGAQALKVGTNTLALHCHQNGGGQYIDVHVIDAANLPDLSKLATGGTGLDSPLITAWGAKVTPANAWREYPRPQMTRENWTNLNGEWNYAVTTLETEKPSGWAGKILVPFCLESKLSGVGRKLEPYEALWYQRTVSLSPKAGARTLLHFEAVDYSCAVMVNGRKVGEHVGGNLPFTFDITEAATEGENEIVLRVEDATGDAQLRGKQNLKPSGIWYTRVSGIWQTVWLEEVPARHIRSVSVETDIATGEITLTPELAGPKVEGEALKLTVLKEGKVLASADGPKVRVPEAQLWSPDHPHLYDLKLTLSDASGAVLDTVDSYTALRKVGQTKDADGHLRFTLNDREIFHWGPLDQGWWPDGLLTPPSEEAMVYDIQFLKDAGFNMIRKHIKVEPQRYYYDCDRLGMMVWQDQVAGGPSPKWTRMAPNPEDATWTDEDHAQYMAELENMMDVLGFFQSIVVWTPFNEARGQHRTVEVGAWNVKRDPTRLVNIASGGNFWPVGHIADEHSYPHPAFPLEQRRFDDYLKVVGEFGGHGWPVKGHLWDATRENWGYGGLPKSLDEYKERYRKSIDILVDLKQKGITGGVYTQTTDVEGEINGILTYDRKEAKIAPAELKKIHAPLFE